MLQPSTAFAKLDEAVAKSVGISPGLYVCKASSRYDGDFDPRTTGILKYIPVIVNTNDEIDQISGKIKEASYNKVMYIDSFEALSQLFLRN